MIVIMIINCSNFEIFDVFLVECVLYLNECISKLNLKNSLIWCWIFGINVYIVLMLGLFIKILLLFVG